MGIIDTGLSMGIAITFNLLVHNITSVTYKELQYAEKMHKSTIMLFIFGIIGYSISKLILENQKNKLYNDTVNDGLKYGGIILMITAIVSNWGNISDDMRIIGIGIFMAYLIYYSYRRRMNKLK